MAEDEETVDDVETVKEPKPKEKVETPVETPPVAAPYTLIGDANAAAERMEKANKTLASLLEKQEALKVETTLGGTATAGTQKMTADEKSIQEAKKLLEGTGYEDLFDEPPIKK